MVPRSLIAILTVSSLAASAALAQSPDPLLPATYPVADLVVPLGGRKGELKTTEADLMERIRKNVAPSTWDTAGGQGVIRFDSKGGLVLNVRQTLEVHRELQKYLETLPRGQVTIELGIASLSDANNILGDLPWQTRDGVDFAVLEDVEILRLLQGVGSDRTSHIVRLPKMTLFDGQDARLDMVDELTFQTGAEVQMKDGVPAVVRLNEQFFVGVKSRCLPRISKDKRSVTVQLEYFSRSLDRQPLMTPVTLPMPADAPAAFSKSTMEAAVQKPMFTESRLAVAATVPNRQTIVFHMGKTAVDEVVPPPTGVASLISRTPYLGRLVRNANHGRRVNTLLVMMTPRIARDPEPVHVKRLTDGIRPQTDDMFPQFVRPKD